MSTRSAEAVIPTCGTGSATACAPIGRIAIYRAHELQLSLEVLTCPQRLLRHVNVKTKVDTSRHNAPINVSERYF